MSNEEIRNIILLSCNSLDDHDFEGFLNLCVKGFKYTIKVFSPELLKDMVWLEHDYEGLKVLFEELPDHLQRNEKISRQLSYPLVETSAKKIKVTTNFCIYKTDLDGKSSIFCIGNYIDNVCYINNKYFLKERVVHLETRDLGIGLHVPI